jgi:hypothetical protein
VCATVNIPIANAKNLLFIAEPPLLVEFAGVFETADADQLGGFTSENCPPSESAAHQWP